MALGFTRNFIRTKHEVAEYAPDLRRGMYNIFVYCDVCVSTYVGDSMVPLLRTINLNSQCKRFEESQRRKARSHSDGHAHARHGRFRGLPPAP